MGLSAYLKKEQEVEMRNRQSHYQHYYCKSRMQPNKSSLCSTKSRVIRQVGDFFLTISTSNDSRNAAMVFIFFDLEAVLFNEKRGFSICSNHVFILFICVVHGIKCIMYRRKSWGRVSNVGGKSRRFTITQIQEADTLFLPEYTRRKAPYSYRRTQPGLRNCSYNFVDCKH